MNARLKARNQIAARTVQIDLELDEEVELIAGQSFLLKPQTAADSTQTKADGEGKFFSIINPSGRTKIISTAMRLRETPFKKFISSVPLGTEMDVSSIAGVFLLPPGDRGPFVFIAGGIGITPFVSMLRTEKVERLGRKITLLYSNPDEDSLAFKDELPIETQYLIGKRIDEIVLRPFISSNNKFYIAGPPLMVHNIYNLLVSADIDSRQIRTEEFTGYA